MGNHKSIFYFQRAYTVIDLEKIKYNAASKTVLKLHFLMNTETEMLLKVGFSGALTHCKAYFIYAQF